MIKTFNEIYMEYEASVTEDYEAINFNNKGVMFSEFRKRVDEIARQLVRLGVREGTGIGYSLANCIDIMELFIAISRLGAYAFPLFHGFPANYKMSCYQRAEVSLVISDAEYIPAMKQAGQETGYTPAFVVLEESQEYDSLAGDTQEEIDLSSYLTDIHKMDIPLLIGMSSGTTGIPKMVAMSQKNVGSEMIVMFDMQEREFKLRGRKDFRKMVAFPFSTSVVLTVFGIFFYHETVCYTDNMTPMNFLKVASECQADTFLSPPAFLESLLLLKDKQSYDLSKVEEIEGGMDFFSPSLVGRMSALIPNLHIYAGGYGLVETCNVYMYKVLDIVNGNIQDTARYELSDLAENQIHILNESGEEVKEGEVGQIFVKGPNVVAGYMETPTKLKEAFPDGWLATGDIAKKVNDRIVYLLGREKYFIKRGGKSVSPIVVQAEINKTEGIKDSAVVGVPHPLFGEMIWAFVVKEADSQAGVKEIKQTCKKNLPFYMLPDQITFIDEIPKKSAVGKVDYDTIKKMGIEEVKKNKAFSEFTK